MMNHYTAEMLGKQRQAEIEIAAREAWKYESEVNNKQLMQALRTLASLLGKKNQGTPVTCCTTCC